MGGISRSKGATTMRRYLPLALTGLLIAAAVVGLAGIDLVLPALPQFPELFETTSTISQYVIALYVAGNVTGLLTFGSLASRFPPFGLLLVSLIGTAVTALMAAYTGGITELLVIRFVQGFFAIAPAVLAAGVIRSLYSETGALRAISVMGSVESLSPALAPVAGAGLLIFGWNTSFLVTAAVALVLALCTLPLAIKGGLTPMRKDRAGGSVTYGELMTHRPFMRFACTQAFLLGGLLVFVFSAPVVIVRTMGGTLWDFNLMQIIGVSSFIVATNLTASLSARFGKERMVVAGNSLGLVGLVGLTFYGWMGGSDPTMLIPLFVPLNVGLGLAGPPSFLSAIEAGKGDDARASALIFLLITITSSSMTALAAQVIDLGLNGPATAALFCVGLSACALHLLKSRT